MCLHFQVGKKPDDFWCYQRAELLPIPEAKTDNPPCPNERAPDEPEGVPCQASARSIIFASDGKQAAAEVAATAAAAAAAAAALLSKTSSIETGLEFGKGSNKAGWPKVCNK